MDKSFNDDQQSNDDTEQEDDDKSESDFSSVTEHVNSDIETDDIDDEGSDEIPRDNEDLASSDEEMDCEFIRLSNNIFSEEVIPSILYNCRKIVNSINKSSTLYEITQNLARSITKRCLCIDMRIRWNSTYEMISRFNEYRPILTQLVDQLPSIKGVCSEQKKVLLKLKLSNEQWDVMSVVESVLDLFSNASEILSGSKYSSYAVAHVVIDTLIVFGKLQRTILRKLLKKH